MLRDVDVDETFRSLRGDSGSPHPENWIPGLSHPSLPPKPPYWRAPDINESSAAPWDCQLNPFLEHTRAGLPILYFDIRLGEESIIFETGDVRHVPVASSNLYQPATYPFVTEVRFQCSVAVSRVLNERVDADFSGCRRPISGVPMASASQELQRSVVYRRVPGRPQEFPSVSDQERGFQVQRIQAQNGRRSL